MTTSQTLPAADRAHHGFPGLRCILCGVEDGLRLTLADVGAFECLECSEEFTADDVAEQVQCWAAVLAWIRQPPPLA